MVHAFFYYQYIYVYLFKNIMQKQESYVVKMDNISSSSSSVGLLDLPEEVLLKVFAYLDITNLLRCSQVCHRIRHICYDKSLWQKVNLCGKIVPYRFVRLILKNGCKYLSLRNAKIEGDIGSIKVSELRYLDCTNCFANPEVLKRIIASCHSMEKISMVSPNKGGPNKPLSHSQVPDCNP